MVQTYVAIGSNLNNPILQILRALVTLKTLAVNKELHCSSLYSSVAFTKKEQPDYVNAVVRFKTSHSPNELLAELQTIEYAQGRVRPAPRHSSRTLDLDLLLYGDATIDSPELKVPHSGILERDFVLYPLFEIAENLYLPKGVPLFDSLIKVALTLKRIPFETLKESVRSNVSLEKLLTLLS